MFQASGFANSTVCMEAFEEQGSDPDRSITKIPTVLIVDDDEDSLYLLSQILEQFTCHLVCETNGTKALKLIQDMQPDLVLLDIWLPGSSGLDIVRTLRDHVSTRSITVVAVTALASAQDRDTIFQTGFNQYISKPYVLEEMEGLLGYYLPRKSAKPAG